MACINWCLWALLIAHTSGLPDVIRIGGLFDGTDPTQDIAFRYAVERVNSNRNVLPRSRLIAQLERLSPHDSFGANKKVCQMVRSGLGCILGPSSATSSAHVQGICDTLELPHLETRRDAKLRRDEYSINLHPHPASLGKAYLDIVLAWGWRTFTILYEDAEGLDRLQQLLHLTVQNEYRVTVRQLGQEDDYRSLLKDMKRANDKQIVLDCATEKIPTILKQAQQVGLMTAYQSYFVTSLDFHTVDLNDYKYGGTNITGIRIVDINKTEVANIVSDWVFGEMRYGRTLDLNEKKLKTETALVYDAVQLFAKALHDLDRSQDVSIRPLSCDGPDTWIYGNSLVNYMKLVEMEGLTGRIKFDAQGFRSNFHLDVLELSADGLEAVGTWSKMDGANFTRTTADIQSISAESLHNKTLTVTSVLADPYFMLKESSDLLTGNDRFEGFCVDIINEVSQLLGFKVHFRIVGDGAHGTFNKESGTWNGMVKELLDGKTDAAIGDLSINYERQQAVDFTMPFMNTGISILYKKPQKKPPSLFSFLSPLSVEVWIYMCTAYLGVSMILFVLARLSPFEWNNPHPCNQTPDILENQFTILNSMWFTIGSLMQQGSDIAPKAVSTRMVAGMWWFFTLIMISSYTANLAAFLTVERMESPIESAEDLSKQTKIKYGHLKSGTTLSFFKNSQIPTYIRMRIFMEQARPSVYTSSNSEGVERVQKSNGQYAFLMESSSIEYHVERKCDLTQIGGMLDSKGYGIALQKNSPYRPAMSQAVLKLQESNRLLILKDKWWKENRGGGACKDDAVKSSSAANELGLGNVGGVFVVLIGGMAVALLISFCEFAWKARKLALEEDEGSLVKAMLRELRDTLRCNGNTKPVRRPRSSPSMDKLSYR